MLGARLRDRQSVVERDVGASAVDVLGDEPRGGDADVGVSRVEFTRGGEQAERAEAIAAALAKLEGAGMTLDLLRETGVGKTVNALKKLVAPPLADRARALVDQWKMLQSRKE